MMTDSCKNWIEVDAFVFAASKEDFCLPGSQYELPRSKLRVNTQECHAREACPREGVERASGNPSWIPASAGITYAEQAREIHLE